MNKSVDDAEAERHRAKMAKRKAVQDAEVADKKIEKGLLIVHTGTGKGKSTAAFGLAIRAWNQVLEAAPGNLRRTGSARSAITRTRT